jgi:hypothetical protein
MSDANFETVCDRFLYFIAGIIVTGIAALVAVYV